MVVCALNCWDHFLYVLNIRFFPSFNLVLFTPLYFIVITLKFCDAIDSKDCLVYVRLVGRYLPVV